MQDFFYDIKETFENSWNKKAVYSHQKEEMENGRLFK